MRRSKPEVRLAAVLTLVVVLGACTPSRSSTEPRSAEQPRAPKHLTIGILQEPRGWMPWGGTSTAGGAQQVHWLATRGLTIIDDRGGVHPVLADSVPSPERGDWRFAADGTMEQTWRIRANAKWQDGHPVTADDFVFAWQVNTAPDVPIIDPDTRDLVTDAVAVDDLTLLLRFRATSPLAGQGMFEPLPRHILGEAFAKPERDSFMNHEYWTTAYIGAGPYRLQSWAPGAYQDFAAFADYVEGPPRIDVLTVRFLADPNTLLANIIGGNVDVALPDGISVEMARDLQQGWAGPDTGNRVQLFSDGRIFRLYFQERPEYARPRASLDPRVHRAFYYTLDKEGINEVELAGIGEIADSWIPKNDPRRPRFADAIPEWAHDIAVAQRILAEAGWRKGADGVLVSDATSERLETEIRVTAGQGHAKSLAVMGDGWRQAGADVKETVIPASLITDSEYRSTLPFTTLYGHRISLSWEQQFYLCSRAAGPENRWTGTQSGYCNPTVDPLISQLQVTIPETDRTRLQAQIMGIVLKQDLAELPLYWQVTPYVSARGITGIDYLSPGVYGNSQAPWNVHLWDRA